MRETIVDGKLVIEAIEEPTYDLDTMLAEITSDSLYEEISTGHAVGQEIVD